MVGRDRPIPPADQAPIFTEPRFNKVQSDHERFGSSVAVGHFTQTNFTELAVGVPGANDDEGLVMIFGFDEVGNDKLYTFDPPTFFGLDETGGTFGQALVAGRFNDDELDDLAIGVPGAGRGRVCVIYSQPPGSGRFLGAVLETTFVPKDALRYFGHALARGDFNDDGVDDLVVGEPAGDDPDHDFEANGTVWVYWGGAQGLDTDHPYEIPRPEGLRPNSLFGWSLAVGNFVSGGNDLKFPDLAVGATNVPGRDARGESHEGVGRVWIFRPIVDNQHVVGEFEEVVALQPMGDWTRYVRSFGFALAVGNFNGDGVGLGEGRRKLDDLAIGAPNSSIPEHGIDATQPSGAAQHPGAGLVGIARHNQGWPESEHLLMISQDGLGLSETSDHFGWAVAAGDFNQDGFDDLAIGSPGEQLDAPVDQLDGFATPVQAGAVFFRFGAEGTGLIGGISVQPVECYDYIATVPAPQWSHEGDHFGSVLFAADVDDDGDTDLIVGAPETDTEAVVDAGAVWIGLNETTPPGPLDGRFSGLLGDCGNPAELSISLRDRSGVVCGHLRLHDNLCVEVEDVDVTVARFVDVVSTERNGNTVDLHYTVQAQAGETIGTLQISAEVLDEQSDMTLTLQFESEDTGVIRRGPFTLSRQ